MRSISGLPSVNRPITAGVARHGSIMFDRFHSLIYSRPGTHTESGAESTCILFGSVHQTEDKEVNQVDHVYMQVLIPATMVLNSCSTQQLSAIGFPSEVVGVYMCIYTHCSSPEGDLNLS